MEVVAGLDELVDFKKVGIFSQKFCWFFRNFQNFSPEILNFLKNSQIFLRIFWFSFENSTKFSVCLLDFQFFPKFFSKVF